MTKIMLPEIIFASSDKAASQRISRLVRAGSLRKLLPRVYTSNFVDADETIVKRNIYALLAKLFPGALLSHRSALEGGPTSTGHIYMTYKYSRRVILPGYTVHLIKGAKPLPDDMPFVEGLFISSSHRAFLENLQISRSRSATSKVLPREEVEARLERICSIKGTDALNQLRDHARSVASDLHMNAPFQRLNKIIAALLRTRSATGLTLSQAKARSLGMPYDPDRLNTFNELLAALHQTPLPERYSGALETEKMRMAAFFDAYFSNYIEGTEFELEEAYNIIFRNIVPPNRPEDAHDIMGVFRVVSNRQEMAKVPETFPQFIELLKARHFTVMEGRHDKTPGAFKDQPNRAGETHFVAPDFVPGTLAKGFEIMQALEPGLKRAIFMMFLVSEVHPFVDGNGRIARIMMNAELMRLNMHRIIIPTVFRDDYLLALRALSRSEDPVPLIKTLDFAQQFSSELDYTSYATATKMLTSCNAFQEPEGGKRIRLPSQLSTKL